MAKHVTHSYSFDGDVPTTWLRRRFADDDWRVGFYHNGEWYTYSKHSMREVAYTRLVYLNGLSIEDTEYHKDALLNNKPSTPKDAPKTPWLQRRVGDDWRIGFYHNGEWVTDSQHSVEGTAADRLTDLNQLTRVATEYHKARLVAQQLGTPKNDPLPHDLAELNEAKALVHDMVVRHPDSLILIGMIHIVEQEIERIKNYVAYWVKQNEGGA